MFLRTSWYELCFCLGESVEIALKSEDAARRMENPRDTRSKPPSEHRGRGARAPRHAPPRTSRGAAAALAAAAGGGRWGALPSAPYASSTELRPPSPPPYARRQPRRAPAIDPRAGRAARVATYLQLHVKRGELCKLGRTTVNDQRSTNLLVWFARDQARDREVSGTEHATEAAAHTTQAHSASRHARAPYALP